MQFKFCLRTQLPLKQGLRLYIPVQVAGFLRTQNPTSTKTRIKTTLALGAGFLRTSQNPTSTKTRIKTAALMAEKRTKRSLRTQLPLKQGLRQLLSAALLLEVSTQNPTSTKTRIKTLIIYLISLLLETLRTQLPLKQGLRLIIN